MGTLRIVSASAGTGKTWRLTEEMAEAILDGRAAPEGVMAITYTRKAAGELRSRLRRRLMAAGCRGEAARIRDGYVGTTHAVCQALLREFAFAGGLSPGMDPLDPVVQTALLREALAEVDGAELDRDATRLGVDWRREVATVIGKARENGLRAAELGSSAEASVATWRALLPTARGDAVGRDLELCAALGAALPALDARASESRAATERAELVATLLARADGEGAVPWEAFVKAGKSLDQKKLAPLTGNFVRLIGLHLDHPRFHADTEGLIRGVLDVAARALDTFDRRKRAARVVDYEDMVAHALHVLAEPEVADALRDRLHLLLVDELQDCAPVQLAIVARLAELAQRTILVGDRKQAIYGFQGSDPELMAAAAEALGDRSPEILGRSFRSRPALVELCSEVFAAALAPHGFAADEVRVVPARGDPEALEHEPVLECWTWRPGKVETPDGPVSVRMADALADGVAQLVAAAPLVHTLEAGARPLRPGDVAILCRSGDHGRDVVSALLARGIPAATAVSGLAKTPEARLVRAALALVLDPEDGAEAALLSWLAGGRDPDAWLAARIEEIAAWRAGEGAPKPSPFASDPRIVALRAVHAKAGWLAPAEALDHAIAAARLADLLRGWPDAPSRLANLEAIRGAAVLYEQACVSRRHACTLAGLVAWLGALDGEADARARPTGDDAVHVTTWHAAKGLEWPVVVLSDLDFDCRDTAFGVHVLPNPAGFDAASPLAGRTLRYWPWPYGRQETGVALGGVVAASDAGRGVQTRERAERARLLYVGFTRARDRLILFGRAAKSGGADVGWLDELRGADGAPVLHLPWGDEPGVRGARAGARSWPCIVRRPAGLPFAASVATPPRVRWFSFAADAPARLTEIVFPSAAEAPADAELGPAVVIGRRQRLDEDAMDAVGRAIHAFLAGDPGPAAGSDRRRRVARACLDFEGIGMEPAALEEVSDALRRWLRATFGAGVWHPEWPLRWRMPDGRLLVGDADLVLELYDGWVVVDHKTFPGNAIERDRRARHYAGQLRSYAQALEAASGKPVRATLLHFPVRGEVMEVR